jgi:hypothetical protein
MSISSLATLGIDSAGAMGIISGAKLDVAAGGLLGIGAGGIVNIDGTFVNIGNPTAAATIASSAGVVTAVKAPQLVQSATALSPI